MAKQTHKIQDPVCGMDMKPKEAKSRSEHNGSTYYFCSTECKNRFDRTPEQFTSKKVA